MMMPGPFEIILLLLFGALILAVVSRVFGGTPSEKQGDGFSLGHATLACPHCKEETRAGVPTCEHCGHDL